MASWNRETDLESDVASESTPLRKCVDWVRKSLFDLFWNLERETCSRHHAQLCSRLAWFAATAVS